MPVFNMLRMKNINTNRHRYVPFMLFDILLALWQCPVASSEALDLLHWVMHAVMYQCIAMAIKMAKKIGEWFCHCFVCWCPGGLWGNTEQVVARWQRPVASGYSPGHAASVNELCFAWAHCHGHQNGRQMRYICSSPPTFFLTLIVAKDHVIVN
jgi:hypothetical protein